MDLVYTVRTGDQNEELRYSLRSVARNLPHDRVWIVGHCPPWLTGVEHIPTEQTATKWQNARANLYAACTHPDVSDRFVLMNDDFFVLSPIVDVDAALALNMGPLVDVLERFRAARSHGPYVDGMANTLDLLRDWGYPDPLSYELHVPAVVDKAILADVIDRANAADTGALSLHVRTLHGNVAGVGGETIADVKLPSFGGVTPDRLARPFLSTNDRTFKKARRALERIIGGGPCRYEIPGARRRWVRTAAPPTDLEES